MILPNKILPFLIGCTIAVPCFGAMMFCPSDCVAPDCTCVETEAADQTCNNGAPGCIKYTTIKFEIEEQEICESGYYVSQCNAMDLSFENIMNILKTNHFRLDPGCWAVDGTLTTAQHYQNMRALFSFDDTDIGDRIANMDKASRDTSIGCATTKSKTVLEGWTIGTVSKGCLNVAINGTAGVGWVCQKCPDGGKTPKNTSYKKKMKTTIITTVNPTNLSPVGQPITIGPEQVIDDVYPQWISFNTIANCYIKDGKDERGSFHLGDAANKCYYSKE